MTDFKEDSSLNSIAIIGMAGRFPKAPRLADFWQNLKQGVEAVSFFSAEGLLASGSSLAKLQNPNYIRARNVLEDVEFFDAGLFGYTAREAALLDPQQRVFLELAFQVLESAGFDPETYKGAIGVFAGATTGTYLWNNVNANSDVRESTSLLQKMIHNDKDFLATRVAYELSLTGPAITVQTACSTSLVAAHLACQSLLNFECDLAMAGGVSITIPQVSGHLYQEGGIISPDGHCRAFDERAQGCVGGDGAGIILLKRLKEAVEEGDYIHAIIRGSAINNDGAQKVGFTAPSVEGQARVIAMALAAAEVPAETISYIEAHGTGTPLGDPIEVTALNRVFRTETSSTAFCGIGSVKTNVGHLDVAAGVAGLIKTVLALQHRQIPPTLNFEKPNPKIDFANSPFYVNSTLREWEATAPRRAGVSSFGIGGTNAHLVLEEAPDREYKMHSAPCNSWLLLPISARTSGVLEQVRCNLLDYLCQNAEVILADVAYTLQTGRRDFPVRQIVLCRNREEAIAGLRRAGSGRMTAPAAEGDLELANVLPLAHLWINGKVVDWTTLHHGHHHCRMPLPTYPFERHRHWIEPTRPTATQHNDDKNAAEHRDPIADSGISSHQPALLQLIEEQLDVLSRQLSDFSKPGVIPHELSR